MTLKWPLTLNFQHIWLPPNNTKMEITPPYYHRYHTLACIFKKICSEKATFEIFYEVWYEIIYLLLLRHNQHPYQYQTHIIRLGSRRRYHLKKRSPQYLLSSQSYVLFSKSAMTFDLKNPRWPPSAAILDFENWTYLCNRSRYRHSFFFKWYQHF